MVSTGVIPLLESAGVSAAGTCCEHAVHATTTASAVGSKLIATHRTERLPTVVRKVAPLFIRYS